MFDKLPTYNSVCHKIKTDNNLYTMKLYEIIQ